MYIARAAAIVAATATLCGCATVNKMAVKGVASTLSEGGDTVTSHDDPDLIAGAMPFALMLHESLLASVPTHEPISRRLACFAILVRLRCPDAEALQRDDYERSSLNDPRSGSPSAAELLAGDRSEVCGIARRSRPDPVRALARTKQMWRPLLVGASLARRFTGASSNRILLLVAVVRALAERAAALDDTWNNGVSPNDYPVEIQGTPSAAPKSRARQYLRAGGRDSTRPVAGSVRRAGDRYRQE